MRSTDKKNCSVREFLTWSLRHYHRHYGQVRLRLRSQLSTVRSQNKLLETTLSATPSDKSRCIGVQVICLFAIHFTWNSTAIHLDWIHTDNRRSRMNITPHQANLPSCTCPCKRSVSIQSCLSQQCGSINIHKYAGMRCRS